MTPDTSETPDLTPTHLPVVLSPDEYRLALLWLVDFEAVWDGLEAATAFVVDGPAKLALIRQRVRPLAERLSPLGQHVDSLAMLAARHWFRHEETARADGAEAAS